MSINTQVSTSPIEDSRKRGRFNGEDHISNLPESLISHILSCLPIKDAVRTCVLSKDWEYKWTSIYNMDIDDRLLFSCQRNEKTTFVDFVERILFLSQNIKSFRLLCHEKYDLGRMAACISAVLRRNVESFVLKHYQPGVFLPRSLHNNSSLRKLKLVLPGTFKVPSKNCFPNLTSLYLYGLDIRNELSNTDTLVLNFPVLKIVKLKECQWLNVKFVEIHAPALSTFISKLIGSSVAIDDYSIKIFGPKLVRFQSWGGLAENFILPESPVAIALLHYDDTLDILKLLGKSGQRFRRLLKEFSNLEELVLSCSVTEAIAQSKDGLALPRYDKLAGLYVDYGINIEGLLELLHSAPSLKLLSIEVAIIDDYDYDVVESVPSCIVSHLDKLWLRAYAGETPHVNLAKFLFKNAAKLKNCYVSVDDDDNILLKSEIIEQLSTFPKASTCLSVIVEE